eukprot:TRINITY_DN1015_c0_g1_i2.p1 TRINITY_DN1015_c0_g1~~TRINITY_DN1015_c0_g1_i2.p1  ORF type:complete len:175 (-),score=38.99 TRINITY_DN1015_c0_g1_i2:34-558(-)
MDNLIPYQHSEALFYLCPAASKRLALADHATHNDWDVAEDILQPVADFLASFWTGDKRGNVSGIVPLDLAPFMTPPAEVVHWANHQSDEPQPTGCCLVSKRAFAASAAALEATSGMFAASIENCPRVDATTVARGRPQQRSPHVDDHNSGRSPGDDVADKRAASMSSCSSSYLV